MRDYGTRRFTTQSRYENKIRIAICLLLTGIILLFDSVFQLGNWMYFIYSGVGIYCIWKAFLSKRKY